VADLQAANSAHSRAHKQSNQQSTSEARVSSTAARNTALSNYLHFAQQQRSPAKTTWPPQPTPLDATNPDPQPTPPKKH